MRQRSVVIDGDRIIDWDSFHDVFAEALEFPDFYGLTMNAWIDCLTYIDEGDGMSNVVLSTDEELTLRIEHASSFRDRCPEQYMALVKSAAFANAQKEGGRRLLNLDLSR